MCKSGTTTLEAALADTPFVLAYRIHPATYLAARHLVRVRRVGLVNLLLDRDVVPEFLQREVTPAALAEATLPLLDPGGSAAGAQRAAFAALRERLGPPGAAERVAALASGLAA